MRTLEFYYDFSCPFAYLASTQIRALAERAGAELAYRPFLLGGVFNTLGDAAPNLVRMPAPRARLNGLDMRRWGQHWGVPFEMPRTHPNRTVLALRAALSSNDLPAASHALFAAYWARGENLSEPAVVRAALDGAGLDGAALVVAAERPEVKAELRARTDEALARGVFGAPACFVDDQLYWGQDRLDQVARALGLSGWDAAAPFTPSAPVSARPSLEFWFDYSSPFAYLGATQVEAVAARAGADIVWRPFLLGGLFRSIGTADVPLQTFAPSKQRFIAQDLERFAHQYGVRYRFPSRFPMRTILPLRATLAADPAEVPRVVRAFFAALWADDRDISDPDVLRALCREAGVDPTIVDRADSAKEALIAAGKLAAERGLCGAPSFVVDGHVFWGQDRLNFVDKALRGWRPAP